VAGRILDSRQPGSAQHGFLHYEPQDGVTLSLVGGFDDRTWTKTSLTGYRGQLGPGRFPVIHGVVGNGVPVTIVDCRTADYVRSGFSDEVRDHDITAAWVMTGVLLNEPDAPVFSELAVELENLTEWDRHDEITLYIGPIQDGGQREKSRIEVEHLEPLKVTVNDLTVELIRRYSDPTFKVRRDRLDTTATTFSYLRVSSTRPKSITDWFEVTKALQDLLTLAMDAPCALLSESLTPSSDLLADESARAGHTVDVFGQHILMGDRDASGIQNRNALFTLGTDGVEFGDVITDWLRIHSDFRTACDLIFGLKYVKEGYAQTRLVTAVAAAESLHEALGLESVSRVAWNLGVDPW
jgi:ApeA N-terminal domain 1